jgi:hypothetical protein
VALVLLHERGKYEGHVTEATVRFPPVPRQTGVRVRLQHSEVAITFQLLMACKENNYDPFKKLYLPVFLGVRSRLIP